MTTPRVSWLHPGYVVARGETATPAVAVEEVRLRTTPKAAAKATAKAKPDEPAADAAAPDDAPEEYEFSEEES